MELQTNATISSCDSVFYTHAATQVSLNHLLLTYKVTVADTGLRNLAHTLRFTCKLSCSPPKVSKCPSGCRLQGLILEMESEMERKLRKVCKTAKMYEDAVEKSMAVTTHIYNYNRRVIVNRYSKTMTHCLCLLWYSGRNGQNDQSNAGCLILYLSPVSELKFVERAEVLGRNLTSLWERSFRLSQQLKELQRNAQKQMEDLYRTEVRHDERLFTFRIYSILMLM